MLKPVAGFLACLVMLVPGELLSSPSTAPASRPSTRDISPAKAQLIDTLENYYAKLYSKPLSERSRFSRLIGVTSLARVGGKPITKALLSASAETDPLVGQLIWEAIDARQATLSPAERDRWRSTGIDLARKGAFPSATIAPLLALLSERPASIYKGLPELLLRVAAENDPAVPEGKPALDAARDAVAAWRDPHIVQFLIARLQKTPSLTPRVAAMLSGLPDAPAPEADVAKFRAVWGRYLHVAKLAAPTTLPTTEVASTIFPPPEMIVDPNGKKWRKDLELPRLQIEAVDLALCIDATGSLNTYNEFIASYVDTLMRVMRLMSDQVRGGVVYYRHEIDESIQLPCCKDALKQKGGFLTRVIEFSPDPASIVSQMLAIKLTGKTGHRKGYTSAGAYAGGIETAMKMKGSANGKRIIVCTGDDKATPGSEKKLLELAEKAKKDGTLLFFVVRDEKAGKSIGDVSQAAAGISPIFYRPDIDKLKAATRPSDPSSAIDQFAGSAFEVMTTRALEASLPAGYRDRVEPLIAAVLPILKAQDAAAKASKGMGLGTSTGK